MSVWFEREDIGKKLIIKKKDGEIVEGILKGFDPVVKIIDGEKQYRFLEAKIEEVTFFSDNPLDNSLDIKNTPFENFLEKVSNYKITHQNISLKEIEKDLEKLKKEHEFHTLYLELSRIFNSLKYAYDHNQLEFKYDKTNRLLYQLDKLYENYDDELIDKIYLF